MEETSNNVKKRLSVPTVILLTLVAVLGCIDIVGVIYYIFTKF